SEKRFAKLEQKRTQVIPNEQEVSPAKDIFPPIEDQSGKDNVQSSMESELPATSLPQSAETLDFVETVHKERVSKEIMEGIREKKLREQNLSSDNTSPEEVIPEVSVPSTSISRNTELG
ncbi:649_t:CDS:2, partial [Racocetra fulgida]